MGLGRMYSRSLGNVLWLGSRIPPLQGDNGVFVNWGHKVGFDARNAYLLPLEKRDLGSGGGVCAKLS